MKQQVKGFSFLSHHGIAKLIDGDYGWQGFYYVREFIEGKSLQQMIDNGEKITPVFFRGDYLNVTYPEDLVKAERLLYGKD